MLSAAQAYARAAVYYHYAKFVFVQDPSQWLRANEGIQSCYHRAAPYLSPPAEYLEIPFEQGHLHAYLRVPNTAAPPPLVLILPGLDSVKEEFPLVERDFLVRGMATLSLDGPGQGESSLQFPIRPDYEKAVAAVIDAVESRQDLDTQRIGAVGVSLGGYYAPRAAAFEERIRACAGIAGPYNFGECWDVVPQLTRDAFTYYSKSGSPEEAREHAGRLSLQGVAERLGCPLLIVHGRLDRLIPAEQAERIYAEAGGEKKLVMYDEGNHVCNNITYKYRPLVADWMLDKLSR